MKATPSTSSVGSKVQNGEKRAFCNTEDIMRKIVPTTMLIDDRARMLIEKCVVEFASSVTNISVGYCAVDAITATTPITSVQGNTSLLSSPAPVPATAAPQRELKSNHIMRSIENMGFAEYQKPLSTYKINLKGKLMNSKLATSPPIRTAPVSTAPVATKKQKGPTGNPVATLGAPGMPKPTLAAMPAAGAISPQELLLLIDNQLRNGPTKLSTAEIMRKFGVSNHMVSKRVNVLKAANVELKGLVKGNYARASTTTAAPNNATALQAAKKPLTAPVSIMRTSAHVQASSVGAGGGVAAAAAGAGASVRAFSNTAPSPSTAPAPTGPALTTSAAKSNASI